MRNADAVKPAVSMTAPAPTAMPDWFTRTRRPLDDRLPKIADGVLVTTRLMDRLAALGCWIVAVAPAEIEKLCQLMAEWLVPAPFWVTTRRWLGDGWVMTAWPWTATPPLGRVWACRPAGNAPNAVATASANTAGFRRACRDRGRRCVAE